MANRSVRMMASVEQNSNTFPSNFPNAIGNTAWPGEKGKVGQAWAFCRRLGKKVFHLLADMKPGKKHRRGRMARPRLLAPLGVSWQGCGLEGHCAAVRLFQAGGKVWKHRHFDNELIGPARLRLW